MVTKRKKDLYIYFRPFGPKVVGIKTPVKTKGEAKDIERRILIACKSRDYRDLDPASRAVCVNMFLNQRWDLPVDLLPTQAPPGGLTLWAAGEFFLKAPEIRDSKEKARYKICILNLTEHFGNDRLIQSIKVADVRDYICARVKEGKANATVNREKGTLSRVYQVLMEQCLVDNNPVQGIKNLSEKSGEREVYLGLDTVMDLLRLTPTWFQPIILTAYYSSMRRGEILGLRRNQVDLKNRIIKLTAEDTKEGRRKRVPIHKALVPILADAMKVTSLETDMVFLLHDRAGARPIGVETFKNPWKRACEALKLKEPRPRFHDLRHTWKTNARRSGIDFEIREAIMGHSNRGRSVAERYGRISDKELIDAIDRMTFDHGDTEILVSPSAKKRARAKNVNKTLTRPAYKEKRDAVGQN